VALETTLFGNRSTCRQALSRGTICYRQAGVEGGSGALPPIGNKEVGKTLSSKELSVGRPPTMRDVGALAGVSLKTVSRVINRDPTVSSEIVTRVRRAVELLDYRPTLAATSLRRADRKTATIGLLLEDVANPFSSALHRAIENVARERGIM